MSEYRYYQPLDIRYGDLDAQGHVNNARYLTFMEHGRISYLQALGLWEGVSFLDIGIILADAHIIFKSSISFPQKIRVGVKVSRLGKKSLVMKCSIEDIETGKELSLGTFVLVAYDFRAAHTISISDRWRKIINEFENLLPAEEVPDGD